METSILEHTRMRKMMGLINEETTKSPFTAGDLRNNRDFKQGFLKMIKEVFEPQGNWGKADVPEIGCYTNEGIINIYTFSDYSEKEKVPKSNWSIINFFNTNSIILTEFIKKFDRTDLEKTINNFLLFLKETFLNDINKPEFEELVIQNIRLLKGGITTEVTVFNELKKVLNLNGSFFFCPGSKSDTKKGEDFVLFDGDKKAVFQVKPMWYISRYGTKTEFKVRDYPQKGYEPEKINYIIFNDNNEKKFYIMENDSDIKIEKKFSTKGNEYYSVKFNGLPIKPQEIKFK
jgi:hypothetical protein